MIRKYSSILGLALILSSPLISGCAGLRHWRATHFYSYRVDYQGEISSIYENMNRPSSDNTKTNSVLQEARN